jgi:sterol desaturase/sphingolipid hydroxylase (fatty acid hydroxylase superfamily)
MDLTIRAIPGFAATMAAESWWLRRRARRSEAQSDAAPPSTEPEDPRTAQPAPSKPRPAEYELPDAIASLTMGLGSLVAPMVMSRLLTKVVRRPSGRIRTGLLATTATVAAATTVADRLSRLDTSGAPTNREGRRRLARAAEATSGAGGVASIALGGATIATLWAGWTSDQQLWGHRLLRDLGGGPLVLLAAVIGWDFLYYWNHRFMHESRFMWAIHVVHHSSERLNLSTALRQPVAYALGTFIPSGLLASLGIRPRIISTARELNLLYQYWVHTELIGRLGPAERVMNTPSHHRVHHGSNPQYLDRNHAGILIIWDRMFGTFEPEDEPPVYGLTKNIGTYNPLRIATHEYADMLRDVASARTWRDRLSYVLREPGWSYRRRAERLATEPGTAGSVAARDGAEIPGAGDRTVPPPDPSQLAAAG